MLETNKSNNHVSNNDKAHGRSYNSARNDIINNH